MIIDASVVIKWFAAEAGSERALELLSVWPLRAPVLLYSEVGNALWKKHRRGEIVQALDLAEFIDSLSNVIMLQADEAVTFRALEIAIQLDHPIYDCVYLALAEILGDVVVTADMRFVKSVADTAYAPLVRSLA